MAKKIKTTKPKKSNGNGRKNGNNLVEVSFMGFLDSKEIVEDEETAVLVLANEAKGLYIPLSLRMSSARNITMQLAGEDSGVNLDVHQKVTKVLSENAILKNDRVARAVVWTVKGKALAALETKKGRAEQFHPIDAITIAFIGMWPIFVEKKLLILDEANVLKKMREKKEKFPIEINVYEQ